MSELGLPNSQVMEAKSGECSTPEVKRADTTPVAVKNSACSVDGTLAETADAPAAPVKNVKKAKKKKKKKKGFSYKSFVKSALKQSSSDVEKREKYVKKLEGAMGGGSFSKMDRL